MAVTSSALLREEGPGKVSLTLNRPEKGNAYDGDMAVLVTELLTSLRKNSELKCLIIRGNGKHFCTGADLDWMAEGKKLSPEENRSEMRKIFRMYEAFLALPVPVIACVHGKIRGGGLGLVSVSDYVIADEKSDFFLPEKTLGLIPGIIEPLIQAKAGQRAFASLEDHVVTAREALSLRLIEAIGTQVPVAIPAKKITGTPQLLSRMEEKLILSAGARGKF